MAVSAAAAWLWSGLWNERFWFPSNVTWADLERETPEGEGYPHASHILAALPLAAGIFILRHLFESHSPFAPSPPPACIYTSRTLILHLLHNKAS
uniref:Uncharacterized protein n=1 Tax=Salvator merianae TaxID=96440 RepID=A0A8D0C1S1_SALMN